MIIKDKNNASNGVTLLEIVVALALFLVIIGVAISIFISIVQHQRRILNEQELLGQISYFTEYISRGLRMAVKDIPGVCLIDGETSYPNYIYLLTRYNSVSGFYEGVKFINSNGVCEEIYLDTDKVLKESKNGQAPQNILSSKFQINYNRFVINGSKAVKGASGLGAIQPRISLLLNVQIQSFAGLQERIFQTTISQRNLIIP